MNFVINYCLYHYGQKSCWSGLIWFSDTLVNQTQRATDEAEVGKAMMIYLRNAGDRCLGRKRPSAPNNQQCAEVNSTCIKIMFKCSVLWSNHQRSVIFSYCTCKYWSTVDCTWVKIMSSAVILLPKKCNF